MTIPNLKLAQLPYPHMPVGVLVFRGKETRIPSAALERLARWNDLKISWEGSIAKIEGRGYRSQNSNVLFTGVGVDGGRLVFGPDDNPIPTRLMDAYGEFSLLIFKNDSIELVSDHFGYGKWYYYKDENVFCSCSSYHLLLLVLQACRVKLEMDIKRSLVNLSQVSYSFAFGQQFTDRMDVKDVRIKLPNEKIVFHIAKHQIEKVNGELLTLIGNEREWDEDAYEDHLRNGKEEIVANTEAVFANEHFRDVVVDLSGGFDSRIVFAAMTNLPARLRKKASVYIRNSHVSDDVEIAHSVNNCFGHESVRFYERDGSNIIDENGNLDLFNTSLGLGSYAFIRDIKKYDADPYCIELMGGGGDILFGFNRVYGDYAKILNKYNKDDDVIKKIAADGAHLLRGKCPDAVSYAAEILGETVSDFPADMHLFQRLHLFYLLFRNNHHFTAHRYQQNLLTFNVLQSRWALKAKWIYWSRFKREEIPPEKVSVDMLHLLNPLLSAIRFSSENDPFLPRVSDCLHPTKITLETNNAVRATRFLNERFLSERYSEKAEQYIHDLQNARNLLAVIREYDPVFEGVACELERILDDFIASPTRQFPYILVNKIYHVGYQIELLK